MALSSTGGSTSVPLLRAVISARERNYLPVAENADVERRIAIRRSPLRLDSLNIRRRECSRSLVPDRPSRFEPKVVMSAAWHLDEQDGVPRHAPVTWIRTIPPASTVLVLESKSLEAFVQAGGVEAPSAAPRVTGAANSARGATAPMNIPMKQGDVAATDHCLHRR
jgi:hypothetical protein